MATATLSIFKPRGASHYRVEATILGGPYLLRRQLSRSFDGALWEGFMIAYQNDAEVIRISDPPGNWGFSRQEIENRLKGYAKKRGLHSEVWDLLPLNQVS